MRPYKIVIDSDVFVDALTLLRFHFQAKLEKETLRQNTFLTENSHLSKVQNKSSETIFVLLSTCP